jgi:hypothetical protein
MRAHPSVPLATSSTKLRLRGSTRLIRISTGKQLESAGSTSRHRSTARCSASTRNPAFEPCGASTQRDRSAPASPPGSSSSTSARHPKSLRCVQHQERTGPRLVHPGPVDPVGTLLPRPARTMGPAGTTRHRHRQHRHANRKGRQGMAREASEGSLRVHPEARQLAQSGRDLVQHPHEQGASSLLVRQPSSARPRDLRVRTPLEPLPCPTFRLDVHGETPERLSSELESLLPRRRSSS